MHFPAVHLSLYYTSLSFMRMTERMRARHAVPLVTHGISMRAYGLTRCMHFLACTQRKVLCMAKTLRPMCFIAYIFWGFARFCMRYRLVRINCTHAYPVYAIKTAFRL